MFTELPRAFAAIYWRSNQSGWNFHSAHAANDMQAAAQQAETVRKTLAQNLEYHILCGDYTHETEQPKPVKLTLLSLRD